MNTNIRDNSFYIDRYKIQNSNSNFFDPDKPLSRNIIIQRIKSSTLDIEHSTLKRKLIDAISMLTDECKQRFKNLVDYLVQNFAVDGMLHKITYNGLKQSFIGIFKQITINLFDLKYVDLILVLCTDTSRIFNTVTYPEELKEVLSSGGIVLDFFPFPKSLEELDCCVDKCTLSGGNTAYEYRNFRSDKVDIYNLMRQKNMCNEETFKDIVDRIDKLYRINSIDESGKQRMLQLLGIASVMSRDGIDAASKKLSEFLQECEFEEFVKWRVVMQQEFPLLYMRTVNMLRINTGLCNEKLDIFNYPDSKTIFIEDPITGDDLKGVDLCGWNIRRIQHQKRGDHESKGPILQVLALDQITSLQGCICYDDCCLDIVGPSFNSTNIDNKVQELNQWIEKCKSVISTADNECLSKKIEDNFKSTLKEVLFKLLTPNEYSMANRLYRQKELIAFCNDIACGLIDKCEAIAINHGLQFKDILDEVNDSKYYDTALKYSKKVATLNKLFSLKDKAKISDFILKIINEYKNNPEEASLLINYCIGSQYSQTGVCYIEFFNTVSNSDIASTLVGIGHNSIRFPVDRCNHSELNFVDKDISGLKLYNIKLEECTSFKGCIANNDTIIGLNVPKFLSIEDIHAWVKVCALIIVTANNEYLRSELKHVVIDVIEYLATNIPGVNVDQLVKQFNDKFIPSQAVQDLFGESKDPDDDVIYRL